MQIRSLCIGIYEDVSSLYLNTDEKSCRVDLIVSVATRVFGLIGMTICASFAIRNAILLELGIGSAFVPLIVSVAIGILCHDLVQIAYNKRPLGSSASLGEALNRTAYTMTAITGGPAKEYRDTFIVGLLIHCFLKKGRH